MGYFKTDTDIILDTIIDNLQHNRFFGFCMNNFSNSTKKTVKIPKRNKKVFAKTKIVVNSVY